MKPNTKNLLELLSGNDVTFYIPPYQRNYEWTNEQCSVFFNDIVKTHNENTAGRLTEHFFGTITYFQVETTFGEPRQLVLIDGQQRITTTMLFLVALRDILPSDDRIRSYIDEKYLRNNNVSSDKDEYKIKLKQVETDWDAYKHIILHEELSAQEKTAAVYQNYRYFTERLKEYMKHGNNSVNSLIEGGLDKFNVVTIELEPQRNPGENPQEIFESMNSLGKPLSLADLVRNYLLLGLSPSEQENLYKQYWLRIEKTLPKHMSDYIRDYMQWYSRTAYKKATETNYKELYSIFKNLFSDSPSDAVLRKLADYASIYAYILPGGRTGHNVIDKKLKDLQYLRVTTAYSFFLGVFIRWRKGDFSDDDVADIMDAFIIYIVRRRILLLVQGENLAFPEYVDRMDALVSSPDKKQKMFEILAGQDNRLRLPNDAEVSDQLKTMNFYNLQYAEFIFSMIEEKITKSRPDITEESLQLEHIMPQTLNDEWKWDLGSNYEEIHQRYVNTIGNLTLTRHNQELGNRSFGKKKKYYENKAGLQIAKEKITCCEKWDESAIKNRADWIIRFLLTSVLPIPDAMRRSNNYTGKAHRRGRRELSFYDMDLIGKVIDFIPDPSYTAKVVSDKEVEFEGKRWKLSPLTREIQDRRGMLNRSGSYTGFRHWEYDGIKLDNLM